MRTTTSCSAGRTIVSKFWVWTRRKRSTASSAAGWRRSTVASSDADSMSSSPVLAHFTPRWQWLALLTGGALLLFLAYGPALTRGPFGINDDYQYLHRVRHGTFDPAHNEQTGMGRPVAAWGLNAAYALCGGSVARLVWLRGVSLAGIVLFTWTLARTLTTLGYSRGFAATVAALVALSPASGVYAAWAASLLSPYALTGALLAGRLLVNAVGPAPRLAAALLLVGVCGTWQAAAPLALFPTLAAGWRRTGQPLSLRPADGRRWWQPWLVCGGAVLFYAVACWLVVRLGWVHAAGADRLTLATDLPAKVRLLGDLLRSGATSWARLQPGFWEWAVGLLTVAACLGALVHQEDGRVQGPATRRRTGLALAMIFLSVSPLLAAREHNAAFRALPILYLTVAFLGVHGLQRLLRGCPTWVRVGVPLALVAASAGAARYHVWHGLVAPNLREYAGLRDQVRRQFPAGPPARLVYLVPPPTVLAAGRLTPSWEYGLVSSPFWWVTRPFLLGLFEESAPTGSAPLDLKISYREAGNPGVPVLDPLPVLLREPGVWREDPRWGRVRTFRGGWLYSAWLGYFNVTEFPILQHHLLGPLLFTSRPERDGDALWFHHRELGGFHTSAQAFPNLFLSRLNGWVFLSDDPGAHAHLYEYATERWLPMSR